MFLLSLEINERFKFCRLDCLRRLSKGTVDFSVFTVEDLVTAANEEIEILITNELRYNNKDKYEYEVVAVVNDKTGIKSRHDLRGKRYCHPGYGYETDWTRILANYFEASVVTPSCDPKLTITENRIKATAGFFKESCKAGPWVNNPILDIQLKRKYPHLCELCGNPSKCSVGDEYWGRRGSLLCLTDGAGDISWARLDDVEPHFGLTPGTAEATTEGYSFLCPDDSVLPLNTSKPCVWVVKPWPVVATKRTKAQEIQEIVSSLSQNDRSSWRYNLLKLMEIAYTTLEKLDPIVPIEGYLHEAPGFLSANSFSGCHPPRTIKICTTSIIENAKCAWLRESAAVYGIEPDLDCIKADNTTHCMLALNLNAADVVMVPSDLVQEAINHYNLKTLFYETVNVDQKYITVAVTRPDSDITNFEDMRGKKSCFPLYDGVAWNTVKHVLLTKKLIQECPLNNEMAKFFGPSCTPGLPKNESHSLRKNCQEDTFNGEFGALHCLSSGVGDVAFVSRNSIRKFVSDKSEDNPGSKLKIEDFRIVCENKSKPCHLSWSPVGQAMVRTNSTDLWLKDTLDVFLQLDNLFGKNYKTLTTPFTMFGKYDGKSNILFHDVTVRLRSVPTTKDFDIMPYRYENFTNSDKMCIKSQGYKKVASNLFFMSTKRDGTKPSSLPKKKITSVLQTSTRAREESTERNNVKKTEVPLKTRTKPASVTNVKDKTVDNNRIKTRITKSVSKTEKPLKVITSSSETKVTSAVTKTSKRNVPVTPPSSRVSKTQYFPSKSMYSNALKIDEATINNVASTSRDIKANEIKPKTVSNKTGEKDSGKTSTKKALNQKDRSKTSNSNKVSEDRSTYRAKVRTKIKSKDVSPDSSSLSERPRTATLRKGSIVNDNIVGPDVPKRMVPKVIKEIVKVKTPSPKFDDYNYEDDFESYESDFEAYSSSSSANLDNISGEETSSVSSSSNNGDNLPSPREFTSAQKKNYKHKQILDNIKESVEKENANLKMQEVQRNNPASLSDEGFEEQKSLQFINFLDAKKKYAHRKSMEIKRKRGEEILNMIRLDTCSFTLFDLPPVPYEIFIKNYGRSNTIQTAVQTNEDYISEEIQTEDITNNSRWTQFPVCFSKIETTNPNYWEIYKSDYLGAGGDNLVKEKTAEKSIHDNYLNSFLLSAGTLILKIQTESILKNYEKLQKNSRDIPFSDGYILFNTTKSILKDCSVKCLSFCCDNNNKVMTVHVRKKREFDGYGSVICSLDEEGDIILWSVIIKNNSTKTNPISYTNWSDVVLVKNTRISLKMIHPELEDLQCTDFVVNTVNSNYVFVSTNYGFIIHHLIKGGRSNVKKFVPESNSVANCLETCPFSSNYFLVGFSDGNINLYSRLVEKPLMVLSDKEGNLENTGIQIIQWSRNKPFIMYTKDSSNTIHIWDLNESDIYPTYSIPFKKEITCMKLSHPAIENNTRKSYMVMIIGTEDGNLYLHLLSDEHGQQPSETYKDHVNTFFKIR
ncbi:hypothetical protein NQ314_011445 [Rhamnusium bicolor]|uniref:Transferrin-like domain-containing protein n=1 Tax=Rhamnusium bicolor TaxID=1586634 RepID=A0AAV8XIT6_9CUCU|nr:hypothetical protein NQ314_011445 [Rhamnusium bicolor]